MSEVDETSLLSLLQCVPESVDSNSLGHWLSRYIVPFVLQHHPQSLVSQTPLISLNSSIHESLCYVMQSELLHWTEERTKLLELVHKVHTLFSSHFLLLLPLSPPSFPSLSSLPPSPPPLPSLPPPSFPSLPLQENWPQNGVQLASAVLETISSFKNPSIKMAIRPHVFNMTKSQSLSPLGGLKSLQDSLSDLLYLRSSLQCTITLSQYESVSLHNAPPLKQAPLIYPLPVTE